MEAIISMAVFLAVMLILWGVSHLFVNVIDPHFKRPKMLQALEVAERIGDADVESDPKAAATRWNLLCTGLGAAKRYKLESYRGRIEAALDVLKPHEGELRKRIRNSFTGLDLPF